MSDQQTAWGTPTKRDKPVTHVVRCACRCRCRCDTTTPNEDPEGRCWLCARGHHRP